MEHTNTLNFKYARTISVESYQQKLLLNNYVSFQSSKLYEIVYLKYLLFNILIHSYENPHAILEKNCIILLHETELFVKDLNSYYDFLIFYLLKGHFAFIRFRGNHSFMWKYKTWCSLLGSCE